MHSSREEVINAIHGERAYQDAKWAGEPHHQHSTAEWLLFIEDYVQEAKRVLTRREEPFASEFARHTLRKIGAMAVAALEQNGVVYRELEGSRPIGASEG